jgi:hypothetical protein
LCAPFGAGFGFGTGFGARTTPKLQKAPWLGVETAPREWQDPAGVPPCFEFVFHAKQVCSATHHAQHCASVKLLPDGGCAWVCGERCKHQPFTTSEPPHVREGFGMGGGFADSPALRSCHRSWISSPASRRYAVSEVDAGPQYCAAWGMPGSRAPVSSQSVGCAAIACATSSTRYARIEQSLAAQQLLNCS